MKNTKYIKGVANKLICLLLALTLVFSYTAPVFAQQTAGAQASAAAAADVSVGTAADTAGGATRSTTQENGVEVVRFDYKSSDVNVLVTLKNPDDLPENAVLSVTPVTLDRAAQAKVEEQVKSENRTITTQKAFDIKFTVNGQEVEPGNTVKVTMSLPEVTADTQTEVLHLSDDSKSVENTGAEKVSGDKLQLETDSFSRYVIINFGSDDINVTIERYIIDKDNPNGKLTYKSSQAVNGVSEDGQTQQAITYDLDNYDCQKIVKIEDNGNGTVTETEIEKNASGKINLNAYHDITLKLYYKAKATESKPEGVTFFDYDVELNKNAYINSSGNYSNASSNTNKIAVSNESPYNSGVISVNNKNINKYDSNTNMIETRGMINLEHGLTGFSQDQTTGEIVKGVPNWGTNKDNQQLYDPGLFTTLEDDAKTAGERQNVVIAGKHVLTDYKLVFDKDGDHYHLSGCQNPNGQNAFKHNSYNKDSGFNFFPLDEVPYETKPTERAKATGDGADYKEHNHYFGMRYDIKFKLGDYVGDLKYKFKGDDDLWVILDGQKVVIDLGGIHSALEREINLWDYIKDADGKSLKENYSRSKDDSEKWHTLTVLYMERGANRSNCIMDFTIPNVQIAEVGNSPKGEFTFDKKQISIDETTTGGVSTPVQSITPLAGAEFSIKKIGEAKPMAYATSGTDGKVTFKNLSAGTDSQVYVIQEEQAPTGYAASAKTYYIKATLNESADQITIDGLFTDDACTQPLKAKADLDKFTGADGYADVADNTVINYPIDAYLKQKKAASLVNWDERTYRIDLYIGQQIPRLRTIDDAMVTDIVDPRFVITDTNGMLLDSGDKINDEGQKDSNGTGIISFYTDNYNNRCYQVTWNDQSIPALIDKDGKNLDDVTLSGWHKIINIKAKTEYVGGNNVTTNVAPHSAVTVSGKRYPFEEPTVNVKPQLFINNVTRTFFAGEAINHVSNVGGMFNLTTTGSHEGTPQCDVINGKYQPIDTGENSHFSKTWYSNEELTSSIKQPDNETATVNSPLENKYYLTAKYTFDMPDAEYKSLEATKDSEGTMHYAGEENHGYIKERQWEPKEGVTANDELYEDAVNTGALNRNDVMLSNGASTYQGKKYGVYTVHVVKGQIQITKKIDNQYSAIEAIRANQTFVYRIDVYQTVDQAGLPKGSPSQTIYETIAFSANEHITEKTKLISNLPKGVYVVTEETAWSPKYNLAEASGSGTNANLGNETTNNGVRLSVGKETAKSLNTGMRTFTGLERYEYQNDSRDKVKEIIVDDGQKYRDVAGYEEAKASFKNNFDTEWKWLSDTAAAVNQFTKAN